MKNVISAGMEGCREEAYSPNNPRYLEYNLLRCVLTNNLKKRHYFDSGDFVISTSDHVTDDGSIKTGRSHPYRSSISLPYAPIPASSNVGKDAIEDMHRKSAELEQSPILRKANIDGKISTIKEGQGKPISDEVWNQIVVLKSK